MRGVPSDERARRVDEMLDALDMRDRADALIGGLGSGERRKVAAGRAVARRAAVVPIHEPTTDIEVGAELALIRAIKAVTRRLRQTIVHVTHDRTEAMTLADEIAPMRDGRIARQDAPRTRLAGWFIRNPGMGHLPARSATGSCGPPPRGAAADLGGRVPGARRCSACGPSGWSSDAAPARRS